MKIKNNILFKKKIVICISGGIAIYKTLDLLRQLVKLGADVHVIMTKNATKFIRPMIFEVLSKNLVIVDLFDMKYNSSIAHIELSNFTEIVILTPATANIIAKLANGIADDALTTFILAVTCPVVVCPSMNSNMYEHPATQRNLMKIFNNGIFVMPSTIGDLACGISGPGRLPEVHEIINYVISCLTFKDLSGKKILVTGGPTREFIDPIRFLTNPSSGKMSYAVAKASEKRGAKVKLISGPVNLSSIKNITLISIISASDMAKEVFRNFNMSDIVIKIAAVSDYKSEYFTQIKVKKGLCNLIMDFEKNIDILACIGKIKKDKQITIGFAAETSNLLTNAKQKLKKKEMDMVVANLVGDNKSGFSSNNNKVILFFSDGRVESLNLMDKNILADIILDRILLIDSID